jgi:hypothetical protein
MNNMSELELAPYIAMKVAGASSHEVFRKAKSDGRKNFECTLIVAGVFDLELHEAREISHAFYRENEGET